MAYCSITARFCSHSAGCSAVDAASYLRMKACKLTAAPVAAANSSGEHPGPRGSRVGSSSFFACACCTRSGVHIQHEVSRTWSLHGACHRCLIRSTSTKVADLAGSCPGKANSRARTQPWPCTASMVSEHATACLLHRSQLQSSSGNGRTPGFSDSLPPEDDSGESTGGSQGCA